MDNQNVLVSNASDIEKGAFYKKTYQHVAIAILAFILLETVLLKTVPSPSGAFATCNDRRGVNPRMIPTFAP